MIPYGRQDVSEEDIDAVVGVLRGENLTQGEKVPEFEKSVSQYAGSKHAIAVNSATSALHLSYLALGISATSLVWTTPITFVATANAALMCGADVDFVDIDPATFNMCPLALQEKLETAKKLGRVPDLVVPVHLAGQSCDMRVIFELSKIYGFRIVEDASHAIGGRYLDRPVGSCEFSDCTVFSFHPVKIITTGEGGMVLTNKPELAHRMALLRSHGITRRPDEMTQIPDGPWYYQQQLLGFNYRMTDIQAALGISQLKRLDEFILSRNKIAAKYNKSFSGTDIKTQYQSEGTISSHHLFIVRLEKNLRKETFCKLRDSGVGVNLHYIPIYRHPFYQLRGYLARDFPQAEKYYNEAFSLPIFPTLTEADQSFVVQRLLSPPGHQTLF